MPGAPLKARRGPFYGGYTSSVEPYFAAEDQLVGESTGSDTASSRDCFIDPRTGGVSKRSGCAIVGDTVIVAGTESVGILNAKWGARARKFLALDSPSISDGYPSPCVLYGEDTNAGFPTTDSGFPGTVYVRSTNGADFNYSLLEEFSDTHYNPTPSGARTSADYNMKVVPIWVDSGDGVYNRGALTGVGITDKFNQQFLTCGSRGGLQTQNWYYSPNLRCTPWRWNKRLNEASGSGTEVVRIFPTGPLPPLFPPRYSSSGSDLPSAVDGSSWVQGDTFYVSCVFQFEDGSYSAPFIPRGINPTLTAGLGLVTVGAISATPTLKYPYITYRNVPIGPEGTAARILLRSTKQNRTAVTDTITVSPLDLRVLGVLRNNTQTVYLDSGGDDDSLLEDDDVVRFDYVMPRRARYIGSGDQRAITSYTLPNTAAILLACTNTTVLGAANLDFNLVDTDNLGYGDAEAQLVRVSDTNLELLYIVDNAATSSGGAGNLTQFAFATYTTIGALVDAINATTVSSNCEMWAAQLAPGIDDTMPTSALTRTSIDLAVTGSSQTITGAAADIARVGVGMRLFGTNITVGTYVLSKPSSTTLTISAAVGGALGAFTEFFSSTGDDTIADSGSIKHGYMRCFGPNLPILLHVKASSLPGYLVPDKAGVHFTISSPGANSSGTSMAPNSWVAGNKRVPVSGSRSVMKRSCTGIVDMEGTALVTYSDGIYMLRNVRGANTGEDEDYRLFTINESRGCTSYLGLASGNGWAAYPTTEGIFACDKTGREFVISGDVYNSSDNTGDLAYELGLSAASASSDTDNQYLSMAVMGSKLVVSFRTQQAAEYATLFYDFSPGIEASGLEELMDPEKKKPYIWSPPAIYNAYVVTMNGSIGAMGSVLNASGRVDYITFEGNNGSAGDGRLEQINTTVTDNLQGYSTFATTAPVMATEFMSLSPQRCEVIHLTSNADVASLVFANNQTPTFGTAAPLLRALPYDSVKTRFNKQIVPIDQGQRGKTDMFWIQWRTNSSTPEATRLYGIVLQYDELETA